MKEWKEIKPDKGVDCIGLNKDNQVFYFFRCNCKNTNCYELRDSVTGYHLNESAEKWEYCQIKKGEE